MPMRYIEEEQIHLLGKMLLHSSDHLTTRERELFDHLVETLNQRVERRRRLERQSGLLRSRGDEAEGHGPTDVEEQQYRAKMHSLRNLSPDEVVKRFIECWNGGDFELEYACLSTNFSKGVRPGESMSDYVTRRQQKHNERRGTSCEEKRVEYTRTVRSEGGQSEVETMEVYVGAKEETAFQRRYMLAFEDGSWKVRDFANLNQSKRPRRKHPTPPSSRRKGRA